MLEIRLLGQIDVQQDGKRIDIASRPAQLLLAYLALHANIEHRREKLAGLIWPDMSDENARNNLRHALWRIRKAIGVSQRTGQAYLLADNDSVTFDARADCWLDVSELGQRAGAQVSVEELVRITLVYQGELLPGFYEDWVLLEREHMQALFEQKMQLLLKRQLIERRWADVLECGERWIAMGHANESAYRALMEAHAALGDLTSVSATYQRCVDGLRRDLEVEPSFETTALHERLLKSRQAHVEVVKPTSAHHLPAQPTLFVERKKEIDEINDLLGNPACRLLTLIGPGGIGKTRLALQAATQNLDAFSNGAYFVSLAPAASLDQLVSVVADTLAFAFYGKESPANQLINYLREKQMLLIMDNFEHLLDAATFLGEILVNAPQVKILVTSRERLHLQWEWILEIGEMDYPDRVDVEGVADYTAVRLFVQIARRLQTRFTLADEQASVVRICQLVQGMPLAIELAAAWVRTLSCAEIARQIEYKLDLLATELRDVPERHRSVQAAFEYSWNLLSAQERHAFKQLSVFNSGCGREAAAEVANATPTILFALIDKSLLQHDFSGRYTMHEMLRQYASEKLRTSVEEDDRAALHTRMARYYARYAARHRDNYVELEAEWANVSDGMKLAHQEHLWPTVIEYAQALADAWFVRGRFADARADCRLAYEATEALSDRRAQAICLRWWGRACIEQSDYDEAELKLRASLDISREMGDSAQLAHTLYYLGHLAIERASYAEAKKFLMESLHLREKLNDRRGVAEALSQLAYISYYADDFETTEQLLARALDIQQAIGDQLGCVKTLRQLANAHVERGAFDLAYDCCQRALALREELQDRNELTNLLRTLSTVCRRRGDLTAAREYAERSLALLEHTGDRRAQAICLFELCQVDADMGDFAPALQRGFRSLEICRQLKDHWGIVYVLSRLGDIFEQAGQLDRAREQWLEALKIARTFPQTHPQIAILEKSLDQTTSKD